MRGALVLRLLFAGFLALLVCAGAKSAEKASPEGAGCTKQAKGYPDIYCGEILYEEDEYATVFVSLAGSAAEKPEIRCSGVLVGKRSVLTAAHCFFFCQPSCRGQVGFGLDAKSPSALIPIRTIDLFPGSANTRMHPGGDFALLTLDHQPPEPFQRQFARILMARAFLEKSPERLEAVGYGISSTTDSSKYGIPYVVPIKVASTTCAIRRLGSCKPFQEFVLADRRGNDSCDGDSGGPALIPGRVPRILVGITSRPLSSSARNCGQGGIYGLVGTMPVLEWLARLVPDLRIVTRWEWSGSKGK